MAYAALVSLGQVIDQVLNHRRYSVSYHQRQQITSIHDHVIFLQAFLDDFPEKANNLEGGIRDIANEAEDILEYLMLEQVHPVCDQLKKVTEEIDSIAGEVMNINNSFRNKETQLSDLSVASSSSKLAPTQKDVMIGFDNDLMAIKDWLCGLSSQLQVLPIFGMGGIGKTTLARNTYDDSLIMEHFHIRAWVTVSQDYSAQKFFSALIESIKECNVEGSGQSYDEAEKVYKSLKGRRYLIVMDDIWSTKVWDDVRNIFPDDGNGSRIMFTTRLFDVVAYPDPYGLYCAIELMDANQSWNLLQHKVFPHHDCPPELENIGKEIAKSCRGLPLAIVVIAGLLSTVSKTPASWREIAENLNSVVATKDGHFEKILSLSYSHLPHHLRSCFLYMAGFPEDYEIRVSRLVNLWVAEGFLKRKDRSKSLEEEAEEYLENLIKRSLIFVQRWKSNGKTKSCSIHDLVRDLCMRKAQEEKFLLHVEKTLPESMENERRVSVTRFHIDCLKNIYDPTIRSIKCFHCRGILAGSLGDYKLLRVFAADNTRFVNPGPMSTYGQLSKLFHLRYLNLHSPCYLPDGMSNLVNLQTIIITSARKKHWSHQTCEVSLKSEIWRMPQLRHLICILFGSFPSPKEETESSALESLQTLSQVTNFICTKRILIMIPNLRKLGIFYGRKGYSETEFHLENLVYLHQLEKLKINIQADFPFRQKLHPVFPLTLKKLTLSGWRLPWERITIISSLPNLEVLKLRDFAVKGSTWETNEGEFLQLKYIFVDKSDLQHWITESSHFPVLRSLVLHRCWCLIEIPDGIGEIPTLEMIEVDNGNKSLVESAKRVLDEQQNWGNDAFQVHVVHS